MDDIRKLVGLFVALLLLVIGVLGGAWWAFDSSRLSKAFFTSRRTFVISNDCTSSRLKASRSSEKSPSPSQSTSPIAKPNVSQTEGAPKDIVARHSKSTEVLHVRCPGSETPWLPSATGKRRISIHLERYQNARGFGSFDRIKLSLFKDDGAHVVGDTVEDARIVGTSTSTFMNRYRTTILDLDAEAAAAERIYFGWMFKGKIFVNVLRDEKGLRPLLVMAVCSSPARKQTQNTVPNMCALAVDGYNSPSSHTVRAGDKATLVVVSNHSWPTQEIAYENVTVLGVRSTRSAAGQTAKVYIVELPTRETRFVVGLKHAGWSSRLESMTTADRQQ